MVTICMKLQVMQRLNTISWILARTFGFALPLILIYYISEETLKDYFLLFQVIQVLGLILSAGFTSLIIDLDRAQNWLSMMKSNFKIFIIQIIFLLFACWIIWIEVKGYFVFYFIGAILFAFRLFSQTLLRKYYEETRVIIATEITYSFILLSLLLSDFLPEISIIAALLVNFAILSLMCRSTLIATSVANENIKMRPFLKRTLVFGTQSTALPILVLVYLLSVKPDDIIEVKLAFMSCTGIVWLQSSIKSYYLRMEHATFSDAILTYRLRIILIFTITIMLYIAMAIGMFFGYELVFNKVDLGILLFLSLSVFFGNVVIFSTVLALRNSQWKLYAGVSSGKLASVMVVTVMAAIVTVNHFADLWAISISYALYCSLTSASMFRLARNMAATKSIVN